MAATSREILHTSSASTMVILRRQKLLALPLRTDCASSRGLPTFFLSLFATVEGMGKK
jgi:hypothetical protein